ncbi:signal peptidase I [Protaetiibacter intestinalis]|uniref:Signal peptidase I n=1 Tax=Protaetiibacter intestinalis TaxID=2419774 RepID=A0A387B4U3_9MICO|nr:signal peptidase I [Protaetiibacter intestinalis]AYF98602.1 signal peptidase I [Protaetiibacter intestinalis]
MSDEIDARTSERAEPDAAETPEDAATSKRKRGAGAFLRDVALIIVAAVVISFLIKTFLIRSFYIPSESMEDTLLKNDRIIVNQLEPDLVPIQHGDVVVFKDPGGWLEPTFQPEQNPVAGFFDWLLSIVGLTAPDSNDHLIKRVIGLPGDHVVCCDDFGRMSVNGVALDESAYVKLPDGVTKVSKDDFDVTVPEGSLWVMGDNRWNSRDSRYNRDNPGNGFVPIDNVVGRAVLITWPIDRWSWLDNYPVTFEGVEEARTTPPATDDSQSTEPEPEATETSGG